jgi:putative endonuclease
MSQYYYTIFHRGSWESQLYFFKVPIYYTIMASGEYFWIYILRVAGDRYYTGYTTDIYRRYREHQAGSNKSRFTRSFPPKKIERCWKVYDNRKTAMFIERFIKTKKRPVKEMIIQEPHMLRQMLLEESGRDIRIQVMEGTFRLPAD